MIWLKRIFDSFRPPPEIKKATEASTKTGDALCVETVYVRRRIERLAHAIAKGHPVPRADLLEAVRWMRLFTQINARNESPCGQLSDAERAALVHAAGLLEACAGRIKTKEETQ